MTTKNQKSTFSKILWVLIFLVMVISAYFLFFSSRIKMEVFNKTNYDIDSLNIGDKFYKIEKNKSLIISDCNSFDMQDGLPFGLPDAVIKSKQKDTFEIPFCGTGIKEIKKGNYQFDVVITQNNNYYRLYWQIHK